MDLYTRVAVYAHARAWGVVNASIPQRRREFDESCALSLALVLIPTRLSRLSSSVLSLPVLMYISESACVYASLHTCTHVYPVSHACFTQKVSHACTHVRKYDHAHIHADACSYIQTQVYACDQIHVLHRYSVHKSICMSKHMSMHLAVPMSMHISCT